MSFFSGLIYSMFGTVVLTRFLEDGWLKIIAMLGLSAYAFSWASDWYAYMCSGLFLTYALGTPLVDIHNASLLRRKYGLAFDLLGYLLIIIGCWKLIAGI